MVSSNKTLLIRIPPESQPHEMVLLHENLLLRHYLILFCCKSNEQLIRTLHQPEPPGNHVNTKSCIEHPWNHRRAISYLMKCHYSNHQNPKRKWPSGPSSATSNWLFWIHVLLLLLLLLNTKRKKNLRKKKKHNKNIIICNVYVW